MKDPRDEAIGQNPIIDPPLLAELVQRWAQLEPARCHPQPFKFRMDGEVVELHSTAAVYRGGVTEHDMAHLLSDLWPDKVNTPMALACTIQAIRDRGWRFMVMYLADGEAWAAVTDGESESDAIEPDGDLARALLAAYLFHIEYGRL